MTVYLDGAPVRLDDRDALGTGGEGTAYRRGGEVLKVYKKAPDPSFQAKMQELRPLGQDSRVVAPRRPLLDVNGRLVGYTMPMVESGIAFPLLFTSSYLRRNGISRDLITSLAQDLFEAAAGVHGRRCLIVDANEYNFLAVREAGGLAARLIDVDSYQTPSFPATAIMPTIQDFTSQAFSELTDWYSIAVVVFQLYTGIHPYRGSHPDFADDDFAARCRTRAWVFGPRVTYPAPAVRPFDDIPAGYKEWFRALFEGGERRAPPADPGLVQARRPKETTMSAQLVSELAHDYEDNDVCDFRSIRGHATLVLRPKTGATPAFTVFDASDRPYILGIDGGVVCVLQDSLVRVGSVAAERLFYVDDRLYAYARGRVTELAVVPVGDGPRAVSVYGTDVAAGSARVMTGTIAVDVFGRPHFLIPFGTRRSSVFHAPALDGYRVLDAFYQNGTLIVVASRGGRYDRFTFKFTLGAGLVLADSDFETGVIPEEINASVRDDGALVELVGDDLRISARGSVTRRVFPNAGLPPGTRIHCVESVTFYSVEGKIYRLTLRSRS